MKKLLPAAFLIVSLLLLPVIVLGQGRQAQGTGGVQQQDRVQDPATHSEDLGSSQGNGNQMQNQNQVQTQNAGEETQLKVSYQQMQQLMDMQGLDEETAAEVKTVAEEQIAAGPETEKQLNKAKSRSGIVKTLFGPDFAAIKALKQQMEQNRLRIEQLTKLQEKIANMADTTQLQTAISLMTQENTSLQEQIQSEENTASLLGWFFKLFNR